MLTQKSLFRAWLPLWISWLAMALELPLITAAISRLDQPNINLAAFGGVVIPVSFVIEGPILMLLSASTALSSDWRSYRKLCLIMMMMGFVLTAVHASVALTPLYFVITEHILGVPEAVVNSARLSLIIMLPWTWAIAYRRFHQGVLIRYGFSRYVGVGTLVRLGANIVAIAASFWLNIRAGAVVGAIAAVSGVMSEAIFVGLVVQPVLRKYVKAASEIEPALTTISFWKFYIPLAITAILDFMMQPVASAALSRMPRPIESLALWPVLGGLLFALRSVGFAFSEVVIANLATPGAREQLTLFNRRLSFFTAAGILLFLVTPLHSFWFEDCIGLDTVMSHMAVLALWFAIPHTVLAVPRNFYQGIIIYSRRTRAVTEGTALNLSLAAALLVVGVCLNYYQGIFVGVLALSLATIGQVLWLQFRSE